jgi:hypothetical protein
VLPFDSHSQDLSDGHDIVPNGYNIGRSVALFMLHGEMLRYASSDELVSTATTPGGVSYGGISYATTAQDITGLLPPGSAGVNHGECFSFKCSNLTYKNSQASRKTVLLCF